MSTRRLRNVERRREGEIRQGVTVELPVFGVGLGRVREDFVHIHVNNRMPYGKPEAIAYLPVAASPNGGMRFVRTDPEDEALEPQAKDIDESIGVLEQDKQPEPRSNAPTKHPHTTRQPFDDSLRPTEQYVSLPVARGRWLTPRAEGLLFVMVYGRIAGNHAELAKRIGTLLRSTDVSRCVVPTRAIEKLSETPESARVLAPQPLCFALASCQYTAGMVDATPPADGFLELKPGPADASYARLVDHLGRSDWRPELLLLTGDQVYVDASAGLFDPSSADGRFLRPYEQFYSSVYVQHVTRQMHVCMMLDDHEIGDNFENESDASSDLARGRAAYIDFQRQGSLLKEPGSTGMPLWSPLSFQGFDFFIADTRTERETRTATAFADKQIMNDAQFGMLKEWLTAPRFDDRPRFVVSPSILFPRKLSTVGSDPPQGPPEPANVLHSDSWDGYPRSFNEIFAYIAEEKLRNVIFLSGDEHRCCVGSAVLEGSESVTIHSIHSSGLYAPYAFANANEAEFVSNETIEVPLSLGTGKHRWKLQSEFAPRGDGFALIRVTPNGGSWNIELNFSLAPHEVGKPDWIRAFKLPA